MITIATTRLFYTHGLEALVIMGIVCTLAGLLAGWILWRDCRAQADRVEKINEELQVKVNIMQDDQQELALLAEELT